MPAWPCKLVVKALRNGLKQESGTCTWPGGRTSEGRIWPNHIPSDLFLPDVVMVSDPQAITHIQTMSAKLIC